MKLRWLLGGFLSAWLLAAALSLGACGGGTSTDAGTGTDSGITTTDAGVDGG